MSEHDGSTDAYRTPEASGPSSSQPYQSQPYQSQPYQSQPCQSQPCQSQPCQSQPYQSQPYPSQPGAYGTPDLDSRPTALGRLRQVMLAGAVAAVLQGVYAAFVVDDLLADSAPDLEQIAAESGLDAGRLSEVAGSVAVGVLVVSTVVTAGLWLLFARLFDRGSARVLGTVLGGLNVATLLVGLLSPTDLVEWVLSAVSAALVVAGLVLLWRPVSSAWFRAAAAARGQQRWS